MIRLRTRIDGLELRELGPADCDAYYDLVDSNRSHLSQHGDYAAERDATRSSVVRYFADPADSNTRFGVWHAGELIGRVDLNPVRPPKYSLGYWLSAAWAGRGFATAACSVAITYACDVLRATDVFAGITHGNTRSIALVRRLGFSEVADFDSYTRFHLTLRRATGAAEDIR